VKVQNSPCFKLDFSGYFFSFVKYWTIYILLKNHNDDNDDDDDDDDNDDDDDDEKYKFLLIYNIWLLGPEYLLHIDRRVVSMWTCAYRSLFWDKLINGQQSYCHWLIKHEK